MVYCEKSRVSPLELDAKKFDTADFFLKFHDLPLESRDERRCLQIFRIFVGWASRKSAKILENDKNQIRNDDF